MHSATIIIPTLNEEANIDPLLEKITAPFFADDILSETGIRSSRRPLFVSFFKKYLMMFF